MRTILKINSAYMAGLEYIKIIYGIRNYLFGNRKVQPALFDSVFKSFLEKNFIYESANWKVHHSELQIMIKGFLTATGLILTYDCINKKVSLAYVCFDSLINYGEIDLSQIEMCYDEGAPLLSYVEIKG